MIIVTILSCFLVIVATHEDGVTPPEPGTLYLDFNLQKDKRKFSTQINTMRRYGYDIDRLDNHTQLKVFLYTWMAMEG